MGNWGSHIYDRPPQKLGEFVQNNLRPSEDCQKQIDQTVDTICKVLQDAEQLPLVISVARVSRGLGSGLQGARGKKDLVLSTYCVPGPGHTDIIIFPMLLN